MSNKDPKNLNPSYVGGGNTGATDEKAPIRNPHTRSRKPTHKPKANLETVLPCACGGDGWGLPLISISSPPPTRVANRNPTV